MSMALMAVTSWRALAGQRGDAAHARVGQREQVLPDPLDVERVLADDERRDRARGCRRTGAHALRPRLGQERTVRLADAHEAGVGGELDDDLAHPG